jgi:hypothetical protein
VTNRHRQHEKKSLHIRTTRTPCLRPTSTCQAGSNADALDRELAARLNEQLAAGNEPDHMKTLRPALMEALFWMVAATVGTVATLLWLT